MPPLSRALCIAAALAWPCVLAQQVEDTMAQRVLACTGCHGPQGRASPEGFVPRIAGKPAGYLYQQLLSFRDGRRRQAGMARLLEGLPDEYLREIAAHFAALDLPPQTLPAPRKAAQDAADAARARTLVRDGDRTAQVPACAACHGAALTGVAPGVPGLVGLPRDYIVSQLGAWRTGTRKAATPDCMGQIALRLDPGDVAAMADWLSRQVVPSSLKPASAPAAPWPMKCGGLDTAP
jgi:cytochrome c553